MDDNKFEHETETETEKADRRETHEPGVVSQVGYRRPPNSTRFKPGQSGNPAGRPKGSLNLHTTLMTAFRKKITINEGGKRRQVSKFEASCIQLANQSASGDAKAFRISIELQRKWQETASPTVQSELKVTDKKIMARLAERFRTLRKVEDSNEEGEN